MYRREFLSYAAGIVTLPPVIDFTGSRRTEVLDLQENCCLSESVAGYSAALADVGRAARRSVLIVPAAGRIPETAMRRMVTSMQAGGIVILESGAGFASEQDLRAHRDTLRESFAVRVAGPVQLWPRRTPYVAYSWPRAATLRDFSRVMPLDQPTDEPIGFADGQPVALRRQVGRGTFIFLGSPLGPALWAGDADAKRWLLDVVRS